MERDEILSRIANLIKGWKSIDIGDLCYKQNAQKYGDEEAKKRYMALKDEFVKVRDVLKQWDLLKDFKTDIASYPWQPYYELKHQDEDNLRFYFFYNPIEPDSNSSQNSLQLNLEFWCYGKVYIFFLPRQFFLTYKKKLKGLEEALKRTGYISYVLQKGFVYHDENRIDGSKRNQDIPDWNEWVGRSFDIKTITADDILNSFEDLKKALDLYVQAVQEVLQEALNAQKFRGDS